MNSNIDFFTMTTNNSEILEKTYDCLNNSITGLDLKTCNLYLNIDPHPDTKNINNLIEIGNKYFKEVIYNIPSESNCSKAFQWGITNFKKDYLFIIEANKCIVKKFDINNMINFFDEDIVEVSLSPVVKEPKLLYLNSHPSLWKKDWLKNISNYLSDFINYEYQIRELALLNNKFGYSMASSDNIYLNHIGTSFKKEKQYLLANSSSDKEIMEIIVKNGEWHKNIYNNFPNTDQNIKKIFEKKLKDKKWIFRWTGVWKYTKNDEYYSRYIKKSNEYICNQ